MPPIIQGLHHSGGTVRAIMVATRATSDGLVHHQVVTIVVISVFTTIAGCVIIFFGFLFIQRRFVRSRVARMEEGVEGGSEGGGRMSLVDVSPPHSLHAPAGGERMSLGESSPPESPRSPGGREQPSLVVTSPPQSQRDPLPGLYGKSSFLFLIYSRSGLQLPYHVPLSLDCESYN
ncbi:hypothetical protein F4777DRAFT_457301 [Nemania sp. FL0916]|nr:hypothetical protein F4777DRAFT_457301 [Nemania sp. FL0916]